MKQYWFRRWGWIYRPVHAGGVAVTLAPILFLAHVFVQLDARSHSVSDTLYRFYVFAAPTFLGLMWVASRTSGKEEE
jgi:hypothetical protein